MNLRNPVTETDGFADSTSWGYRLVTRAWNFANEACTFRAMAVFSDSSLTTATASFRSSRVRSEVPRNANQAPTPTSGSPGQKRAAMRKRIKAGTPVGLLAYDGDEALSKAMVNTYDLICLDLTLPDIDDFRPTNPAVNPPLLAALAEELIRGGFELKPLVRAIVLSRTYQAQTLAEEPAGGTRAPPAEVKAASLRDRAGHSRGQGLPICRQVEISPAHRDGRRRTEFKFRSNQRDFERRRVVGVADQQIRQAVRERIHRSGHGNSRCLRSPASEILHCRQQPRAQHVDHGKVHRGDASGTTNPLTITMNANKNITATFSLIPPQYNLTISVNGSGNVAKSPDLATYNSGSNVTLTASPGASYVFDSWSEVVPGNPDPITYNMNPLTVSMNSDKYFQ